MNTHYQFLTRTVDTFLARSEGNILRKIALEEIDRMTVLKKGAKVDPEIRQRLKEINEIARKAVKGEEWF